MVLNGNGAVAILETGAEMGGSDLLLLPETAAPTRIGGGILLGSFKTKPLHIAYVSMQHEHTTYPTPTPNAHSNTHARRLIHTHITVDMSDVVRSILLVGSKAELCKHSPGVNHFAQQGSRLLA